MNLGTIRRVALLFIIRFEDNIKVFLKEKEKKIMFYNQGKPNFTSNNFMSNFVLT